MFQNQSESLGSTYHSLLNVCGENPDHRDLQKSKRFENCDQLIVIAFFRDIFKSDFKIDSASCQIEMHMTPVDFCNLSKSRLDVANRTLAKESILKSNSIKKSTYLIFAMNFSPTDRPLRIRRRSSQD